MSSPTNANDPAAYNGTVTVSAQPARINAGGIVLLTVDLPTVHDTYELVWDVVGSVRLSQRDTHIALLGATTVTGGQVTLPVEPENQLQATLDTSPLTVGSWRVRVQLTKV